jgi:hypothetical protein
LRFSIWPLRLLVTTVIFFSAWHKSRVKWDNSRNSTQKMRNLKKRQIKPTLYIDLLLNTILCKVFFKRSICWILQLLSKISKLTKRQSRESSATWTNGVGQRCKLSKPIQPFELKTVNFESDLWWSLFFQKTNETH